MSADGPGAVRTAAAESRLNIRGHAVEPVLLMFPLGLAAVTVLVDVFQSLGGPGLLGALAYCTLAAGLLGGTVTAIAVWLHGLTVGNRDRARAVTLHFLLNGAVLTGFAVILLLRLRTPDRTIGPGLLVVELICLSLAALGGLMGARWPDGREPTKMGR